MKKEKIIKTVTSEKMNLDTKLLNVSKTVGFGSCSGDIEEMYWSVDENKIKRYIFNVELVYIIADLLIRKNVEESIDDLYDMELKDSLLLLEKYIPESEDLVNEIQSFVIVEGIDKGILENIVTLFNSLGCSLTINYNELKELDKKYLEEKNINLEVKSIAVIDINHCEYIHGNSFKELADNIIFNVLDDYFGAEDDQVSKEMLKNKDFQSYVKQINMCYGGQGKYCKSLNRICNYVDDFLNVEEESKFVSFLDKINIELDSIGSKARIAYRRF